MNHAQQDKQQQQSNQDGVKSGTQNTAIDASDSSRNDERDARLHSEPDTERLRSERESGANRDPE